MEIPYYEFVHESVKHCALTKYIRRHGIRKHSGNISLIFKKCDMDDHIGCLPPELLNLINGENVSEKTMCFFDIIDDFLYTYRIKSNIPMICDMPELRSLFNTDCFLQTYEQDENGERHYWYGTLANVYKICFPALDVSYALKIYKHNYNNDVYGTMFRNGPIYEIANGFCAHKSKPKFNNRIYMAKLQGQEYIISKWLDSNPNYSVPKKGPFEIHSMTDRERKSANFINGLCVDFGEMTRTSYGQLSYQGRKFYRQMFYGDMQAVKYAFWCLKNNFDKRDFQQALELFLEECNKTQKLSAEQKQEIKTMISKKNSLLLHEYLQNCL